MPQMFPRVVGQELQEIQAVQMPHSCCVAMARIFCYILQFPSRLLFIRIALKTLEYQLFHSMIRMKRDCSIWLFSAIIEIFWEA